MSGCKVSLVQEYNYGFLNIEPINSLQKRAAWFHAIMSANGSWLVNFLFDDILFQR